jgi:hypothetical protein
VPVVQTLAVSKGTLESRPTRCSCNFSDFKSQNRVIDQQRERKKEKKKSARPGNPEALFPEQEAELSAPAIPFRFLIDERAQVIDGLALHGTTPRHHTTALFCAYHTRAARAQGQRALASARRAEASRNMWEGGALHSQIATAANLQCRHGRRRHRVIARRGRRPIKVRLARIPTDHGDGWRVSTMRRTTCRTGSLARCVVSFALSASVPRLVSTTKKNEVENKLGT